MSTTRTRESPGGNPGSPKKIGDETDRQDSMGSAPQMQVRPSPTIAELIAARQERDPWRDRLVSECVITPGRPTRPIGSMTLPALIGKIRDGAWRATVARVRELTAAGLESDAKDAKLNLPAVTLSGRVTEGGQARAMQDGRLEHSGFLQGDFDGKDHPSLSVDQIREIVRTDPHVVAGFVSPSGTGVKAVIRVPRATTEDEHKACFATAEKHFAGLGLTLDTKCKDPGRLCFVSHDPDAWIVDDFAAVHEIEPIKVDAPPPRRPAPTSPRPAGDNVGVIRSTGEWAELTLDDLAAMLEHIPGRPDYDEWIRIASGAWSEFGVAATAVLAARWPEEKPGEYDRKFKNRLKDVGIGTVVWNAARGGYSPPVRVRSAWLRVPEDQAQRIAESVDSGRLLRALGEEHRGLAEVYASIRFGTRAYVHDECGWRRFSDGVWEKDLTSETIDDLQTVVTALLIEAANKELRKLDPEKDKGKIESLKKRSRCLLNLRTSKTVLENAQSLQEFRSVRGDYDQHPHLLAIENGTIDFDRCEVRSHAADDMLTVRAPLVHDPAATCPTFDAFLRDVTCGDQDLEQFLLERTAYALTGHTWSDEMVFHVGGGSNGKSTFVQTVEHLLGNELFKTLDNRLLVGNREQGSDEYLRASLESARLAVVDELPDGRRLRTDELKKLVGGDSITARNPYERQRTFRPSHKLWMAGNHKPDIGTTDHGTWRRILLMPWNAKFSGEGPTREERIAAHVAERGGILNRLLDAWRTMQDRGAFLVPDVIRAATREYMSASDQVGQFASERIQQCDSLVVPLAEVLKSYQHWCAENGENPSVKSSRKMGEEVRRLGFSTRHGAGGRMVVDGIALVD